MKFLEITITTALLLAVVSSVFAHSVSQGDVTVTHPWTRPTPPGVSMGVGYMAISNNGETDIRFIGAATPKSKSVSIHESTMKDGLMTMRPLSDGLTIPAGETLLLEPHGYHLMLEGLSGAITEDETFPMTLTFEGAEAIKIELHTMPMDPSSEASGQKHQH